MAYTNAILGALSAGLNVMHIGADVANATPPGVLPNTKSIARGSKDSTFQFPCLMTDSVGDESMLTISKTLDKVYAAFTQTWISMNSMFNISIDPTPISYLKRIHQNFNFEWVDDLIVDEDNIDHYMEKVYDGSYRLYMDDDKTFGLLINESDKGLKNLVESNKDLLREHLSDFNLEPIELIREAETDGSSFTDLTTALIDTKRREKDEKKAETNLKMQLDGRRGTPTITDREMKRSNDMVPYGISVKLIAVNDKKEFVQYMDVVIGIKTIVHRIDSKDAVDNIVRVLYNKNPIFKFLRWTTGELSLVKDLILNIDDIKTEVNREKGKVPFFSKLKRLKERKFTLRNLTIPQALIPNATLVITEIEANEIKDKYGVDVHSERQAMKLISSLFLICFMILDNQERVIKVIYDGDTTFQTYSVDVLEAENTKAQIAAKREVRSIAQQAFR